MNECDWNVYRTRFVVRARQLTDSLIFTDALGRRQSGEPGDYLVEIFDGLLSITPKKFFEDIYVPLEQQAAASATNKVASQPGAVLPDRKSPAQQSTGSADYPSPRVVNDRGSPVRAPDLIIVVRPPARPANAPLMA